MQQTKIVKVFLGSSITELKEERGDISSIGDDISNLFSQDNIAVRFVKCENLHTGNIGIDDQLAIDQKLRGCELSLFLFRAKAGKWTVHEFEVARALQKEKPHRIFVYFLRTPDEIEKDDGLTAFQQCLNKENIIWKECDSLSDVKFSFAMGVLAHLGIIVGDSTLESKAIARNGDARFAEYEKDKQHLSQLQKDIHKDIDDLLVQIKNIMSDDSQLITARVIQAIELYKKADQWAAATDYEKEKYSHLLFDYASFLNQYGLYHDAEAVYIHQIELAEELYGKEHKNTATSYNDISTVYLEQANYKKALEYCQKAIVISEKVLGADHPETAIVYNNIGSVYVALGNCKKALKYYGKALAINEEKLGKMHLNTAICYNNIGEIYYKQGDYSKAVKYYQEALAIDKEKLGTDNPGTATDYNNIGTVYRKQGKYDMALVYHLKAMEIRKNALGEKHPDTAHSYNNIGWVFREQADYNKALNYYDKAYQILKNIFGDKYPKTKDVLESINYVKKALENEKKHSL